MKTVAVVDYGMGNLRSVSQAVQHVAQGSGFDVLVTSRPQDVRDAERIVLPGQGAMPDCMRELRDSGLLEPVLEAAASSTASCRPDSRSSRMQSGIAPWPGSTTRSAANTSSGLAVTTTSNAAPLLFASSRATCNTACDTERRLPMP